MPWAKLPPSVSHPPTPSQESGSCLSWSSPSFQDLGEDLRPASQVLPTPKSPLPPHSPPETQAPVLSPTLSGPYALTLSSSLFQMGQHLAKAEAKLHTHRGHQELSESVYTDVLDKSCSQAWQE